MSICASGLPVLSRVTMPASRDNNSGRLLALLLAMRSAVITLRPGGLSCGESAKRVAVTTKAGSPDADTDEDADEDADQDSDADEDGARIDCACSLAEKNKPHVRQNSNKNKG